ncbi:hypothetical protein [Magnetococcus sp. PR-3]|uniref:hypothetical protein n=1 Tax=Magnetococcus sp. PR-3 TaxID=3120355 RepID=UPI002FCE3AF7
MEWIAVADIMPPEKVWIVMTDCKQFWVEHADNSKYIEAIIEARKPTHWAPLAFPNSEDKRKNIFGDVQNDALYKYQYKW